MVLALFLIQIAAGLVLALPVVGRREAGVKFLRLNLAIVAALVLLALVAHRLAGAEEASALDALLVALVAALALVLRYPKRRVYRLAYGALLAASLLVPPVIWHWTVRPPSWAWSLAGAWSATAVLGSVNAAMLLGHWYLVVRGMSIDPLLRLCRLLIGSCVVRTLVVVLAVVTIGAGGWGRDTPFWELAVRQGIFFWMRVGWGLIFPLALWPMIWGTARIRSTMAATGILYVAVVAVVIGEVLALVLALMARLPV